MFSSSAWRRRARRPGWPSWWRSWCRRGSRAPRARLFRSSCPSARWQTPLKNGEKEGGWAARLIKAETPQYRAACFYGPMIYGLFCYMVPIYISYNLFIWSARPRLYGPFFVGPNLHQLYWAITRFYGQLFIWSIFWWFQSTSTILGYLPAYMVSSFIWSIFTCGEATQVNGSCLAFSFFWTLLNYWI